MTTHNRITFELQANHAHDLINELEHCMSVINRDKHAAYLLWYLLSFQLNGKSYDEAHKLALEYVERDRIKKETKKENEAISRTQEINEREKLPFYHQDILQLFKGKKT